jgi:DNA-binding LacI/PurR family transcriptional regulator
MTKLGRIVISLEQPPGGTWDHQILRGLQPLLQERDYALIMHDAFYNATRDRPEVPFDEHDMDALIVDGHAAPEDYLRRMRSAGVPIVLLGRTLPDSDIPAVMPDNFGGRGWRSPIRSITGTGALSSSPVIPTPTMASCASKAIEPP